MSNVSFIDGHIDPDTNRMTQQEAIVLLSQMYLPQFDDEEKEALTMAIYALEKQIPKKAVIKTHKYIGSDDDFVNKYHCPVCNALIINEDTNGFYAGRKQKHCDCGQALDWSDAE